jgi:lysophospholipase L1-like esterase
MISGRREVLKGLALSAGTVAFVLLGTEGALRVAGWVPSRMNGPGELFSPRERLFLDCYPSNPRGYFDVDLRDPAASRRYEEQGVENVGAVAGRAPHAVEFRYNALWFRDRDAGPRRPGTVRVAVLGDSFTEGQGVKEPDTAVRRLERALAAGGGEWEVLNCARRGADFPGLYKMFDKAMAFEPDLVLYAMVLNDAARSKEFDTRQARVNDWILDRRRLLGADGGGLLFGQSRLIAFVEDRVDGWRIGRDSTRWYLDLYGEPNAAGWRRTQEMMRDMDQRLRARGGRLVVAAWPLLVDFDHYPFEAADAEIARFCAQAGIPRLDLRPALAGRRAEKLWVHPTDHHPNEEAHRLAAEALAPFVRQWAPAR